MDGVKPDSLLGQRTSRLRKQVGLGDGRHDHGIQGCVGAVKSGPCRCPGVPLTWLLRCQGLIECIQILQHRRTEVAREPDRRDGKRDTGRDAPPMRAATALSQIKSR